MPVGSRGDWANYFTGRWQKRGRHNLEGREIQMAPEAPRKPTATNGFVNP